MYYVYMLRCKDNSLYTGITTDIRRRYQEHLNQGKKSAKYTRVHGVLQIEAYWSCQDRRVASQLEYWLKTLDKSQKEQIIFDNHYISVYLQEKIGIAVYKRQYDFISHKVMIK